MQTIQGITVKSAAGLLSYGALGVPGAAFGRGAAGDSRSGVVGPGILGGIGGGYLGSSLASLAGVKNPGAAGLISALAGGGLLAYLNAKAEKQPDKLDILLESMRDTNKLNRERTLR